MPVSTKNPAYVSMAPKVERAERAFSGDVHGYVPKLSKQTHKEWKAMVERPSYYNVVERTAQALIGALIRKPWRLQDLAHEEPLTTDANFDELLQRSYKHLLLGGRVGVLVDFDEEQQSPKLVAYAFENIINWSDTFIVLEECVTVADKDDPYVLTEVPQWRELRLNEQGQYEVRVWQQDKAKKHFQVTEPVVPLVRGVPLTYIPFWFASTYGANDEVQNPPLATLADLNISHFKLAVDLYHGAHFHALLNRPGFRGGSTL